MKGYAMQRYSISQLYEATPSIESSSDRANPLDTVGTFDDAELIDVRISPQRSRAGIICDVKWCADFEGSNTALVVLSGIGSISWTNDEQSRQLPWHARYVTWEPQSVAPEDSSSLHVIEGGADEPWALDASPATDSATAAQTSMAVAEGKSERADYRLKLGRLSVSAFDAVLYVGHIDGLDGAPPDMTELSDADIIAGFPQWSSVMDVREFYIHRHLSR